MSHTMVIIDSSYYNFYRFFATVSWYNYSPERREAAEGVEWLHNDIFMKTFEKMWFENIKKITKKFAVTESDLIFARDGQDVWRYKLYPNYKATRCGSADDDPHAPGPVFKYINEHFHPRLQEIGAKVIRVERAEGDDIAAVTARYIRAAYPTTKIVIITSDHDFLQLCEPGWVDLYQLKGFKQITSTDPRGSLMQKILSGDPSDNIPGAFPKCGKKTAQKLATDPNALAEAIAKHGDSQYLLNCMLVDFDNIPKDIVAEIEYILDNIL